MALEIDVSEFLKTLLNSIANVVATSILGAIFGLVICLAAVANPIVWIPMMKLFAALGFLMGTTREVTGDNDGPNIMLDSINKVEIPEVEGKWEDEYVPSKKIRELRYKVRRKYEQ